MAGRILVNPELFLADEIEWARLVLANWRACHNYPINTFQATLRQKLKTIDGKAIVAQRLKRSPSIIQKLRRFGDMKLARMHDIGGLRAVVSTGSKLKMLEGAYKKSRFAHRLNSSYDYIANPKEDGSRSIHLVYRYKNHQAPEYDDLLVELQLRTLYQHAWATAVETMGTYLGQALKSGQGDAEWRAFFVTVSAALAVLEKTEPVPGFENFSESQIFQNIAKENESLNVHRKLAAFSIATNHIRAEPGQGAYHLVVLDCDKMSLSIRPYSRRRLDEANMDYSNVEERVTRGENIEVVLVSAGPVNALRRAYPNYFLDTQEFLKILSRIIRKTKAG